MPARTLGKITCATLMVALVTAVLLFDGRPTRGRPPGVGELVAMTTGVVASVLLLTIPARVLRLLASRLARSRTSGSR
jgi:hypothetical protein